MEADRLGAHPEGISIAMMKEWEDATWAAGIEEEPVMRRAGKAVAE